MIAIFVLIAFVVVVAGAAALVMLYKGDKLENIRAAATVVSAGAAWRFLSFFMTLREAPAPMKASSQEMPRRFRS